MAFPLALLASVGQAGLGIASGMSQQSDAAASSAYQNTFNSVFQNIMTDASNRMQKDVFGRQIDQFKQQKQFNADAANRAYAAEQRRLNEQFTSAAFQRQGLLENLVQVQGANNASESYGNSARRANLVGTLGAYGRQQAVMAESLASARTQSRATELDIGRQNLNADFSAWQGVSIAPQPQAHVPNYTPPRQSGLNTALMIGNSVLGAVGTFNALKAPSAGNSGFNTNLKIGSGGGQVGGIGTFGPNFGIRQ